MNSSLSPRRLAVLVSLVLFGMAVLFASVAPNLGGTVLLDNGQDCGHVVVFGIISVVAFAFGRARGISSFYNYTQAALVGVICGIGIEAIQYPLDDRDASLGDVGRDSLGVLIGLLAVGGLVSFRTATKQSWSWRVPLLAVALALFLFGISPVIECVIAQRRRDRTMPVLMSTEHFWWERFLSGNDADWWLEDAPADWVGDPDRKICHVAFYPEQEFPNIHLREPAQDWSAGKAFTFEIYSPSEEAVELELRINDVQHDQSGDDYYDRFNRVLKIPPGHSKISIPLSEIKAAPKNREMDMSHICGLFFFLPRPTQEKHLLFDNVQLDE